ncbi:hypothetical protein [Rhizobium rhizogenes]|jgi:hypothetical protein|uniref:hypothetical protein n=1 Tax=Rhizobium rhizogenes TaxID=359 RepID=UPI001F47D0FE|nr:hypothetical protein [Rhizobium rhizogenes]
MDHIWEISALTPRAAQWIKANFADHLPEKDVETIKTDLLGANALTGKARLAGFLTEYVGPNATSYF